MDKNTKLWITNVRSFPLVYKQLFSLIPLQWNQLKSRVTWSTIIKRRTVESNIRQMLGYVKMSRLKPTIFALNTKIFFTYSREKIIFTVTYIKINADNSQEKAPYLFDN